MTLMNVYSEAEAEAALIFVAAAINIQWRCTINFQAA